ncbi:MAG TPA: hypothetical protein VGQ00_02360 [Candidatus Norongarragalinales archaeon]|jgi:hypothetical protein|nr:hypothetical protein [Candidatus Norongarragalinales archaeon]
MTLTELITTQQERALLTRLKSYYEKLYPQTRFMVKEENLSPEKVANVIYTFPGQESEATFEEKTRAIAKALKYGYHSPVILLRTRSGDYVLDGHRRLKVAFDNHMSWPALILECDREPEFGIKKLAKGRISQVFKK